MWKPHILPYFSHFLMRQWKSCPTLVPVQGTGFGNDYFSYESFLAHLCDQGQITLLLWSCHRRSGDNVCLAGRPHGEVSEMQPQTRWLCSRWGATRILRTMVLSQFILPTYSQFCGIRRFLYKIVCLGKVGNAKSSHHFSPIKKIIKYELRIYYGK